MRKILSVILLMSMIFSNAVYAQETDKSNHELDLWGYEQFISMLSDIDVVLPESELSESAKKGEFVKNLIMFFGYSGLVKGGTSGTYQDNMNAAYELGWITESEKNSFNAEDSVILGDAARYIINALGYNKKPGYLKDAENSYLQDATSLGIYSGVTSGWNNPISNAQMLKLFYNTMKTNIFKYNGQTYEEGETMLYEIHEVKFLEGIVSADSQSGINGKACGKNSVEIDGVVYACEKNTDGLVGKFCVSLVRDGVVLHIFESAKKNNILKIDNTDISDFGNLRRLTYFDENEKTRSVDFEYPPSVFVNGTLKAISSFAELDKIAGENGETEVIDNDNDGKYEIIKITNYITYVADRINYNRGIITDSHADKTVEIDLDKCVPVVIRNGETAKFEDIKANDVVEISADSEYINANGERCIDFSSCEYVTIIATSISVGGIVNKIADDYIEIDETKYELSGYFTETVVLGKAEPVKPGMSGAFFENHAGKIVYVNTAANALDKYGFLVWGSYDEDKESIYFRIFTSDEKVEMIKAAEKITVDGQVKNNNKSFTNTEQLFVNTDGRLSVKNQLVIYRLNSEGEIKYIDTAIVTNDNEDSETCLRLDMEFYRNTAATETDIMITSATSKYNSSGNVYANYASGERYSNVNLKPVSEVIFKVSGFLGDTTQSDYSTNKNQYMLKAHDNMQIAEPLESSVNFEITTSSTFGVEHSFGTGECIKFYNVNDDNGVKYMVYYDLKLSANSVQEATGSAAVGFYAGSGKAVNKNDEVTDYIKVYVQGETEPKLLTCKNEDVLKNMTYSKMDLGGKLTEGDIIRYAVDINGEVTAVKRDVDFKRMKEALEKGQEPDCFANDTSTGIAVSNNNYNTVVRWLATNGDNYFSLMSPKSRWSSLTISEAVKKPVYRAAFAKLSSVLIYDTVEEKFVNGTLNDLFAAKECGDMASVLYVKFTVSRPSLILAYNFK